MALLQRAGGGRRHRGCPSRRADRCARKTKISLPWRPKKLRRGNKKRVRCAVRRQGLDPHPVGTAAA
eukprot:15451370-Alexandrium_andersonii.AAC.1